MAEPDLAEVRPDHHAAWARRAVLLVEIVSSGRRLEQDEDSVGSDWRRVTDRVKRDILPLTNGRLIRSLGDGMLLDFEDVRSAMSAALAIQEQCARANGGRAPDRQILLRMAMEASDAIVDDVLDRGVDLAVRLMSLAGPGDIVVSEPVRDGLTPGLDADIEDLGDCAVHGNREPVRAYRVGAPGPQSMPSLAASVEELAPSVAIVPFVSLSLANDHGVIGEILAEELIRWLSRAPDLKLVSRLSTRAFNGRCASPREVGGRLGADYVLSGAYRVRDVHFKLDVELAEARTGRILWAETLEDNVAAIVDGEQELIGHLISAVGNAIARRELPLSRSRALPTLEGYAMLMGAISLMHRLSPPDFGEAHRLLQALTDRGVHHPLPMAWLAYWHVLRVQQGWSDDSQRDTYTAAEYTKRALGMDPDNSLALAVNGFVHMTLLKRFEAAQESYQRALAVNPSNALAWLLKGALHAFKSDGARAVEHTERALALSPLDPHRYLYDTLAATAALAAGRYYRAFELAQRALKANRKRPSTLRSLMVAQWQLGQHEEARQVAQELLRLQPDMTVGEWLKSTPAANCALGGIAAEVFCKAGIPA